MIRQYAFFFDSSACTGCKACQAACKDHNSLEVGRLWRRVYEVVGGGWSRAGEAWVSDVFAYNLSISCNHCQRPICMEVCPAKAISKRADGIVLIDVRRCIGCKYCSWACPYGAPQYDESSGVMTKCDFCVGRLEAGLPPACVAACPLRALDYGDFSEMQMRDGAQSQVPPLPGPDLTRPSLVIRPHRAAQQAEKKRAHIANREEV